MKATVILPESLVGRAFPALLNLLDSNTDSQYILFKYLKQQATIAGVSENYNKVIEKIHCKRLEHISVEEDGLDEYLFLHRNEAELYITPTESASQVISSAALMEFSGKLFIYATSASEPPLQNLQPHIRAFSIKKSIGTKGLNTANASYSHVVGKECHFKIDGRVYTEAIRGRENSARQGIEGYTQVCEENSLYRIKIWDSPKKQFEIDKVQQMISYPFKNDSIALPLAFVYNDHNNPIGFVMRNFSGEDFKIENLRTLPDAKLYVRQILEQLIWLETHGFLHRDVNHNIIINKKDKKAHIIDTDSIQFRQLPACASSVDPQNFLPEKYETRSAFYNTVGISYTGLSLLAALLNVRDLFGVWDDTGFCPLDEKVFSMLKEKNPVVASFIKSAHAFGMPISLVRQLVAVNDLIDGTYTKVAEFTSGLQREAFVDSSNGVLSYSDEDYGDDPVYEPNHSDPLINKEKSSEKYEEHFSPPQKNNINVRHATAEASFIKKWILWLRRLILSKYMPGTVAENIPEDILWKIFKKSGLWKKPLFTTSIALFAIIVLVIAIIQL